MNLFTYSFLLLVLFTYNANLLAEKVLIFTYSYNRPDFIEIQDKTFKKFLKDDYEFIVFNDATDKDLKLKIEQTCSDLGIRCIRIPQIIHSLPYLPRKSEDEKSHVSVRNCNVVQYSLNSLGFFHEGIVALFDSDLFLVKEFSIKKFMEHDQIGGIAQCRYDKENNQLNYLWIGLAFLDMAKLPNKHSLSFNTGNINDTPVDSGGFTHFYLKQNPDVSIHYLGYAIAPFELCDTCTKKQLGYCTHNREALLARGFDEDQITFLQSGPLNSEFFENGTFVHYRSGSNWDLQSDSYHKKKTQMFVEYIRNILAH